MNMIDLAEDYLVDPKESIRKVTTSLLNEVMQLEADQQIQAKRYALAREKLIVTAQSQDLSRPFTVK